MRFRVLSAILLALACSSDPDPTDAGADDAGGIDATPDAGMRTFACKSLTCNGVEEYCQLTPVGPCTIIDGGGCAASEEACVVTGGSGCTPVRTPSCEPLGVCIDCACLIAMDPCGPQTEAINCLGTGGTITLACPYPP